MTPLPTHCGDRIRLWVIATGLLPRVIMLKGFGYPGMYGSVNRFQVACCSMYGSRSTAQLGESRAPFDRPHGSTPVVSWWLCIPRASCLRLLEHLIRAAASRTFWT